MHREKILLLGPRVGPVTVRGDEQGLSPAVVFLELEDLGIELGKQRSGQHEAVIFRRMLARELQRALSRASGYHANDETLGREDTLPPSTVGPLYVRGLWLVAGPGPTFLQVHDGVLGEI